MACTTPALFSALQEVDMIDESMANALPNQCHGTTRAGGRCRVQGVQVIHGFCHFHAPRADPNEMNPFPDGGGWRGVDLDGTLAHYEAWEGPRSIGPPVPAMQMRVVHWLAKGDQVAIVTARVSIPWERKVAVEAIEKWCLKHLGQVIPITHTKNFGMFELWDDRAVQVVKNTGIRVDGK